MISNHICPKADECNHEACTHKKLHEPRNNCTMEPCGTFGVVCIESDKQIQTQLYICPEHELCSDVDDCKHAKPHDPDVLNDDCVTDPCPYGDDLKVYKEIYCVPYMKPYKIELDKDLFEI